MKYLENLKLTELSSELSEAVLRDSHRIIDGRIEAYTMKRAGNDKKYAHALGQMYVAEMEDLQDELAATVERRRKRSNSESVAMNVLKRAKSSSGGDDNRPSLAGGGRVRAQSFDFTLDIVSPKTTLGDFTEISTRRLMTDLILTLNASFPDYDFSNVKPNQFERLEVEVVRKQIYQNLSELASQKSPNWLVDLWCALNDVIELRDCDVYSLDYEIDDDSLWHFHYFFVNKALRRIVFFTCAEKIDEEIREEEEPEQVRYYNSEAQLVDDFDWDPSDNVAGGMSLEVSIG
jgi:hypothetical protein